MGADWRQQQELEEREMVEQQEQSSFAGDVWRTLSKINVNDHVEQKMKLSYLSWAWAWATLMDHYPESQFEFHEPVQLADGSYEIWVTVRVQRGKNHVVRKMWLPVMDHKNQAVKNPDSRKINDTRMRCLTKCLALFGLGHYIYAGEDLPEGKTMIDLAIEKHAATIKAIKDSLAVNDLTTASEAWFELSDEEKKSLWLAPSKGGPFTTEEIKTMKTADFRRAYYGSDDNG